MPFALVPPEDLGKLPGTFKQSRMSPCAAKKMMIRACQIICMAKRHLRHRETSRIHASLYREKLLNESFDQLR
jgi:hypothetical protein